MILVDAVHRKECLGRRNNLFKKCAVSNDQLGFANPNGTLLIHASDHVKDEEAKKFAGLRGRANFADRSDKPRWLRGRLRDCEFLPRPALTRGHHHARRLGKADTR
jgi:hypothetical protein